MQPSWSTSPSGCVTHSSTAVSTWPSAAGKSRLAPSSLVKAPAPDRIIALAAARGENVGGLTPWVSPIAMEQPRMHARPVSLDFVIVDDDASFREAATTLLLDLGHRVVGEAGSVGAARSEIGRLRPDAVLLDVNLPDGDGFSLARELRDNGGPTVLLISTDPDIAPRRT